METVKTDNELIAEFMEKPLTLERYTDSGRSDHKISYDGYYNEWNNLMPVVEKIEKLYSENFPIDFVKKMLAKEPNGIEPYIEVIALPLATPITEAHAAVVSFIKWYNSNKS
jgi:hypothetical protein